mgnify:FL=1
MKRIAVIVGTRGELIGMAPVIKEAEKRGHKTLFIHTGQHYDSVLYRNLLADLELPKPDYFFGRGPKSHGRHIARALTKIERILLDEKPDIVLAQGNNNATVASALACVVTETPLGHVEAGVRHNYFLGDTNRRLVERAARHCFAPFKEAALNLAEDGIPRDRIYLAGDTYLDAAKLYSDKIRSSRVLERLGLTGQPKPLVIVSVHTAPHREPKFLRRFLDELRSLDCNVVWTLHPAIEKRLDRISSSRLLGKVKLSPSVTYSDFHRLLSHSSCVITDSGVTQEEAYLHGKPCIAFVNQEVRSSPYPMLIREGWIRILNNLSKLAELLDSVMRKRLGKPDLRIFGDGKASRRILDVFR